MYAQMATLLQRVLLLHPAEPDRDVAAAHAELSSPRGPLAQAWNDVCDTVVKTRGFGFVFGLAAFLSLVLLVLPQGQDILTTIGEQQQPWEAPCSAAMLLLFGLQCWFWMRRIVEAQYGRDDVDWKPARGYLDWAPRVTGATPLIAVTATVIYDTYHGMQWRDHASTGVASYVSFTAATLGYIGFVVLRRPSTRDRIKAVLRGHRPPTRTLAPNRLAHPPGWGYQAWPLLFLVVSLTLLVVVTIWPVAPAKALGPAAVVFLAASCVLPVVTALVQVERVTRIPILLLLLGWAGFSSCWNSDQHKVGRRWTEPGVLQAWRPSPGAASLAHPDDRPNLEKAFLAWYADQDPGEKESGQPIPLVVVAAEGGASRAGLWTAVALERLQAAVGKDRSSKFDGFSQHLFAISSVSGGSVGAVGWVASLQRPTCRGSSRLSESPTTCLDAFAGEDALSPPLAAMLFGDLIQRFWPWPVFPDRARAGDRLGDGVAQDVPAQPP